MSNQILIKWLTIFILIFILTGCWDQKEIDNRAYVLGIGLDKGEERGYFKVTYLISNPESGSTQQGGGTDEPAHEVITLNATSFVQAQNTANAVIAKEITYDIFDFFVVSQELAKDEDFIRLIYDATKDREIRRDAKIIISKEKASEFLKNTKPKMETRNHVYYKIILDHANAIGYIPNSSLHHYFRITEADAELFLAALATTKKNDDTVKLNLDSELIAGNLEISGNTNPTQFLGSAVFKEGKMIGTMTVQETRIAKLINRVNEKPYFLVSFPAPFNKEFLITSRFNQFVEPTVKINKNKPPKIHVDLPLHIEILTDHSMVNYSKHPEKREELKMYLEEKIGSHILKMVKRTQEELKGDPFGFGLIARKNFLTISEWEQYDWMNTYPDAEVTVQVRIEFGEFGRQSDLPSFEEVRD